MNKKLKKEIESVARSHPVGIGVIGYTLLTFAPRTLTGAILPFYWADALFGYVLPGGVTLWLTAWLFEAKAAENLSAKKAAWSVLYGTPAAIFCFINLLWGKPTETVPVWWIIAMSTGEELLARGYLLNAFVYKAGSNQWKMAFLASLIFGLVHFANVEVLGLGRALCQCIYCTVLGMLFSWAYLKTGSMAGTVFWHTLINITAMAI